MRLFYFPEFWVLLFACLYAGTAMFLMLWKSFKRDKKFDLFLAEHFPKPNVSEPRITKNMDAVCPYCRECFKIGITDKGDLAYLYTREKYDNNN